MEKLFISTLCPKETTQKLLRTSESPTGNASENSIDAILNRKESEKEMPLVLVGRVYLITNLINNKKYVGVTSKTIEKRFNQHIKEAKGKCPRAINKAIKKYGKENFKIELIEEISSITEKELLAIESSYIEKYNTIADKGWGYNLVKYVDGRLILSENTRNKMSASLKGLFAGNKNYFYGKRSFGKANPFYGKTHTKKTKDILSLFHRGKSLTEKTKQKMSLAHIGNAGPVNNTIRKFKNTYTDEEFVGTQRAFIKQYGLKKSGVSSLIKGRNKSLFGWILM